MTPQQSVFQRLVGKGLYPAQMAWMLLLPFRNLYLSPAKLARRLELREDSVVLELGFVLKQVFGKGRTYTANFTKAQRFFRFMPSRG